MNENPMSPEEIQLRRKKQAIIRKKRARAERKRKVIKFFVLVLVFILVFAFYEKGMNLNFNFKFNGFKFDFLKSNKKKEAKKEGTPISALNGKFIAYVPIDDRSIHTTRVSYLAETSGYELRMPETKYYKTYLQSGENSYSGFNTKFGNPAKTAAWLLEMEEEGCDYYIISLDQLFSGGIAASQYLSDKDLEVYEKGITTAKKTFEKLVKDGNNHVYIIDSVMGLSSTPGFLDFTEEDFKKLYAYTNLPRLELGGKDLTIDKITENYPNAPDGTTIASDVDLEKLNRYLAARERKLEYAKYAIGVIGDLDAKGNIHLYYGIDDSGNSDLNIQRNDIAFLQATAQSNDVKIYIYDGVYSLCEEAFTDMVTDAINQEIKVKVRYYGDPSQQVLGSTKNYSTIMTEVTSRMGVTEVESKADYEILVYTKNPVETQDASSKQLLNQYLLNIKNHIPTVIINDADYHTDQVLINYLSDFETHKIPMSYLIGYSNWSGFIHSSRLAISSGTVRYLYLTQDKKNEDCDRGFTKLLAESFIEDIAYLPNQGTNDVRALEEAMDARMTQIKINMKSGNIITDLVKYDEIGIREVKAYNYKFPWGRPTEIDFDISATVDDTRHSIKVIESF